MPAEGQTNRHKKTIEHDKNAHDFDDQFIIKHQNYLK